MEKDTSALNNNNGSHKIAIVSSRRVSCAAPHQTGVGDRGSVCGLSKETWSGIKVGIIWVTYVFIGSIVFMLSEIETEENTEEWRDHHVWARFKEVAGGMEGVEEVRKLTPILLDLCYSPIINKTFGQLSSDTGSDMEKENWTILQRAGIGGNVNDWWENVERECGESLKILQHITINHGWSMVDSIYYTMTAVTTIGYGHIYPRTPYGRIFCVLYCLVGVPLTCILLVKSTDMLSNRMAQIHNIAKKRHPRRENQILYGITCVYLTVGFIVFMFLPSILISWLEDWTYNETLYMTFITLTTIGFGDFYPGYKSDRPYSQQPFSDIYKMCIIIWIMTALGYWFLLLNFLQKVIRKNVPMRIKRMRRSPTMAKQSAFFKQMVSKAVTKQREGEGEGSPAPAEGTTAALVGEVADVLATHGSRRASRTRQAGTIQGDRRDSNQPSITLAQLLDINIILRSGAVPTVRSAVAQSPKEHELTRTFSDIFNNPPEDHNQREQPEKEEEVVLPLRDVLNLVTLIKSVQDEVNEASSSSLHDDSSSLLSSPLSTVNSLDNRDYVPLLGNKQQEHKNGDEAEMEGLSEYEALSEADEEDYEGA